MTSTDPDWNPRPDTDYARMSRDAYHWGYSDAYHGHAFDAGEHGAFSTYRVGYWHGSSDRPL